MKVKFPTLIHVTEEDPEHGDPWLQVHRDGVASVDTHGQAIAVYRLVRIGKVSIQKTFTEKRPAKKR